MKPSIEKSCSSTEKDEGRNRVVIEHVQPKIEDGCFPIKRVVGEDVVVEKESGSEESLNSEKYEIKPWDIDKPDSLKELIVRVNRIRRRNAALQNDWSLQFHPINNEQMVCYSKHSEDLSNIILVVVNLDPHHTHGGWLELPLSILGLDEKQSYQVYDLLSEARYLWYGPRNYVELNAQVIPAHIFRLNRRVRTERDFDYFM